MFIMLSPTLEFLPVGVYPAVSMWEKNHGTLRASAHCSIERFKIQMSEASVFGARRYSVPAKDHCA